MRRCDVSALSHFHRHRSQRGARAILKVQSDVCAVAAAGEARLIDRDLLVLPGVAAGQLEDARLHPRLLRDVVDDGYFALWRPIVRQSVQAYLKCGDLREGFACVRCPHCAHEMVVVRRAQ